MRYQKHEAVAETVADSDVPGHCASSVLCSAVHIIATLPLTSRTAQNLVASRYLKYCL
jgi:hypothetical protein